MLSRNLNRHFWNNNKAVVGKIDPDRGIFDNFLKNISPYEFDLDDVTH